MVALITLIFTMGAPGTLLGIAPLAVSFIPIFRSSSLLFGFFSKSLPCFTDEDTYFFFLCLQLFHTPITQPFILSN